MHPLVRLLLLFSLVAPTGLSAQTTDPGLVTGRVTVAAAANLSSVAEPLKAAFLVQYPRAAVDFVFGASGALTTQIQNGAPVQLFLSADVEFPQKVADAGLAAGPPKVYAVGRLILLSVKPLDFRQGLALLTDPAVTQFALANPETAPYGRAALEALKAAGLWDQVKSKAVTAQTITQAVQYTVGATGLGFVHRSALFTKDLAAFTDKEGVNWIGVDPALHQPIRQAFVVLKTAAADPTVQAFAAFLSGPEARAVFLRAGYAVP